MFEFEMGVQTNHRQTCKLEVALVGANRKNESRYVLRVSVGCLVVVSSGPRERRGIRTSEMGAGPKSAVAS